MEYPSTKIGFLVDLWMRGFVNLNACVCVDLLICVFN